MEVVDTVLAPVVERFAPTWLLLSAGFDAHRADPLTGLGLAAGDYVHLTRRLAAMVPAGRTVAFLEGGYDLDALTSSTTACVSALAGADARLPDSERPTSAGPGREVGLAVARVRERSGLD